MKKEYVLILYPHLREISGETWFASESIKHSGIENAYFIPKTRYAEYFGTLTENKENEKKTILKGIILDGDEKVLEVISPNPYDWSVLTLQDYKGQQYFVLGVDVEVLEPGRTIKYLKLATQEERFSFLYDKIDYTAKKLEFQI